MRESHFETSLMWWRSVLVADCLAIATKQRNGSRRRE
jgi:hypothetical protein